MALSKFLKNDFLFKHEKGHLFSKDSNRGATPFLVIKTDY